MSHENLKQYAEYQSTHFRTALREESKKNAEKRNKVKNTKTPKVPVRLGVFEIRDNQFQPNLAEIQKLPLFMKFYSGQVRPLLFYFKRVYSRLQIKSIMLWRIYENFENRI